MGVVHLREPLRQMAGGSHELALDGETVGQVLQALEREHPAIAGWILDERGALRRHINVYVNGEQSRPETPVAPDDDLFVLPAISGGAR